jgi:AraC-like DNA-binding protein
VISEHAVLVALVREYLAAHPGATIQQTACACGASRQTIDRALKVCVGQPFRSLRDEYRFRAIAALVAERPPLLVKEIAFALGFSTARSFARWTRRVDGRAPRELRQALKR